MSSDLQDLERRAKALLGSADLCWLGWDGHRMHGAARALHDGDLLVHVYGAFLYCEPD